MANGDPRTDGMVWNDIVGWTMPSFNPAQMLQDSIDKARAWDAVAEKNLEIGRLRTALECVLTYSNDPHVIKMVEFALGQTPVSLSNGER